MTITLVQLLAIVPRLTDAQLSTLYDEVLKHITARARKAMPPKTPTT